MSIGYFVEGKIKTKVKGDYLIFSKENIRYNTSDFIEQQGNKTGVQYKDAKKINLNDTPTNLIDVSLNLFFDGTQNNKTNTELGKDYAKSNHEDDSYTNDYSNVARGYDVLDPTAENQVAEYIEGIGTTDSESDNILPGVALGLGSTGVTAKVTKGCVKGAAALKNYAGKNIHLKVNVFGFSRGAATARHFVHIATNKARVLKINNEEGMAVPPNEAEGQRIKVKQDDELVLKHGYFGACLRLNKVIPKKTTINFVGLYDTVASYGPNHRGTIFGINILGSDTEDLGLNAINKAFFTLQIAADDEFRDNFDLTNIKSTGVKGLEFTLPGVHSDIGGCYVDCNKEVVDLYEEEGNIIQCEKYRKILIEEGWYKPEQLYIQRLSPHRGGVDARYLLRGERILFNTYDKVSLSTMLYYSSRFNVIYKKERVAGKHSIKEAFLSKIYQQLLKYMSACGELRNSYIDEYNKTGNSADYIEELKKIRYEEFILNFDDLKILRNQYLHWSASVTKFGLAPKIGKVTNGKERKRNIQNG
jgi:hypothetical protein